jgi:hypothetical protein
MEALVTIITGLGLVGSVSLVVWGLALCWRHGFAIDEAGPEPRA